MSQGPSSSAIDRKRPVAKTPLQLLSPDERRIYDVIHSKQDMGVSIYEIKYNVRDTVPETVVTKIVKILQGRSLVKEVKNIQNKGRNHFMAVEFEPSRELTGGDLYADEKLDVELKGFLNKFCLKHIKAEEISTAEGIANKINKVGVVKFECSTEQIMQILKSLILDDKIVEVKSSGTGEFSSIKKDTTCYKIVSDKALQNKGRNHFMAVEFEPSRELTGGDLYADEKLDVELQGFLNKFCLKHIKAEEISTAEGIANKINKVGVVKFECSTEQIMQILKSLILDNKIVEVKSSGTGEFSSIKKDTTCYKIVSDKALQNKGRNHFMAVEFEPSRELTGGDLYADEKLDVELQGFLNKFCLKHIKAEEISTAEGIANKINKVGVVKFECSTEQIMQILKSLILDNKIVEVKSSGTGEFSSIKKDTTCYKIVSDKALQNKGRNHFMAVEFEPSRELTGGDLYADEKLDVELQGFLNKFCLKHIKAEEISTAEGIANKINKVGVVKFECSTEQIMQILKSLILDDKIVEVKSSGTGEFSSIKKDTTCYKIVSDKALQNKGRNHFMAVEFEPSRELTGGDLYADEKLDVELQGFLNKFCLKHIKAEEISTAEGIANKINKVGVVKFECSTEQIMQILKSLILDNKIVEVKSSGTGEFSSIKKDTTCYKIVSDKALQNKGRNHFMAVEFEPSRELTGGDLYADEKLDVELQGFLNKFCLKHIKAEEISTAEGIANKINKVGVVKFECSTEQIMQILKSLILDNKIVEVKSSGTGEFSSIKKDTTCYKIVSDKALQNKGRNHFMAVEFEPSRELTGGDLYADEKLDVELQGFLNKFCLKHIKAEEISTAEGIANKINKVGVVKFECSTEQIMQILKSLILDDKIVEVKSSGTGEFSSIKKDTTCYKIVSDKALGSKRGAMVFAQL